MAERWASSQQSIIDQLVMRQTAWAEAISKSKNTFIVTQTNEGLLDCLLQARQQLDAAEEQILRQLTRRKTSLFSYFSSPKRVVPADVLEQISDQFEAARALLYALNVVIFKDVDETNIMLKAAEQKELLLSECDRYQENKGLGQAKIFMVMQDVMLELDLFYGRVNQFLKETQHRIDDEIQREITANYREFTTTPLGKFVASLIALKQKTASSSGKPTAIVDRQVTKLAATVESARDSLKGKDYETATNLTHQTFDPADKLNLLLLALPEERFQGMLKNIHTRIHMAERNPAQTPAIHYRRYS